MTMRFFGMGLLLSTLLFSSVGKAYVLYDFNVFDTEVNGRRCLSDWQVHGPAAWLCDAGKLSSLSPISGMKNLRQRFLDGSLTFQIASSSPVAPGGRGETVVWLRNSPDISGMKRIRIVIEGARAGRANVRIEEMRQSGGYIRLAAMPIASYVGLYLIELNQDHVNVTAGGQFIQASTSVMASSGVYFFASGAEGGSSLYDNIEIEPYDGF